MKKIFFLAGFVLLASLAYTQPNKRVSAFNYKKDGDLDLAKEAIDKCVVHPKTIHDAKAWLYYGQIYYGIATSTDKAYMNLDSAPELKSYTGYKNALLYNFKDESFWTLDIENNQMDMIKFQKAVNDRNTKYVDQMILMDVINGFSGLSNALINKGLKKYQEEKDYASALELFEHSLFTSQMVGKIDTQAVYFCALAAVKAKESDKAIEYYKVLAEVGYGSTEADKANNYYFLAKQYLSKGDTVKFVKTVSEGIDKYPKGSGNLAVEMINFYLANNMKKEALEYLDKGIETTPNNPTLYLVKGNIYNTDSVLHDNKKAIESYEKAISIDSTQFDAYYNIAAIYIEEGAAKKKEANDVDPDNFKKYKMVKAEADKLYKKAIPYLEKAHEINPKDMAVMQSLKQIYYRAGELEKSEAIKKEMEGK